MRYALVLLLMLLGGCSLSPSRDRSALREYIQASRAVLATCLLSTEATRRERSATRPSSTRECGIEKQAQLIPIFNAARDRVRMEKGTTMHLAIHRSMWTAIMAELDAIEGWGYTLDAAVLGSHIVRLHDAEMQLY